MRRTLAVLTAVVLGLLGSAGQASANDGGGSAEQAAAQAAASAQSALALAGALQAGPANANTAAKVLSPGDAGSVTQSNTVIAGSVAANGNSTNQTTSQTQSGGSGTQTTGQIAANEQSAVSTADAEQLGATNQNIDVRVLSPGDSGSVSQSNTVLAGSLAGNGNQTEQGTSQSQAGGPAWANSGSSNSGSNDGQTSGQAAANKQAAGSDAAATQYGAKNTNITVRVLSPGNDGSVSQSNTVAGIAAALNGNATGQSTSQSQAGSPTGSGTQTALQGATSHQGATSSADAKQHGAKNENIAVRVLSPGNGGDVQQSNAVLAGSLALNTNGTSQSAAQEQGGRYGGSPRQVSGQAATSDQAAASDATAAQGGASNGNLPIRILSEGDDGAVSQANTVAGLSAALNGNGTTQSATQSQGAAAPPVRVVAAPSSDVHEAYKTVPQKDAGTGVQVSGQLAGNQQYASSSSEATQAYPSNTNAPIRIGSPGGSGATSQSNTVLSAALALNLNKTSQDTRQSQSSPGGTQVQAAGQAADNKQDAVACAKAAQRAAENTNTPVRVFSHGDDGSTSQSNTSAAIAAALNGNATGQALGQFQAGGAGSTQVQGAGQAAPNRQSAAGSAEADQHGARNGSSPTWVGHRPQKPCEPKQGCEPKRPVEPAPCEPTPAYDRCGPKRIIEPAPCKPTGDRCHQNRPVEPRPCAPRAPELEGCEPCERHEHKCPSRRWASR
ncbi:MAG: hypothetical protein M3Q92_07585 [Actinomycetota bacterium]|nr:hypothetical protein [Actinomycetota bacterium]